MLNTIKKGRPDDVRIPVYFGDSLQWSRDESFRELRINVPEDETIGAKRRQLVFPESVCVDFNKFEIILNEMIRLAGQEKNPSDFKSWIDNQVENKLISVTRNEYRILSKTYTHLLELQQEERNHIWGYVARNLTRPIWLSSEKQKADVVIGNPPWLKFNSMHRTMQNKLKEECFSIQLWDNKKSSSKFRTSQDISTYFFVRSVELYMKEKGKIAFVMPYGVMNGEHHLLFRKGVFVRGYGHSIHIQFKNAWIFDSQVKNLFKVPACVLFSVRREESEKAVPKNVISFKGVLPQKNANLKQANKVLSSNETGWPEGFNEQSYYYDRFQQGASLVPRRFLFVKKVQTGRLGGSAATPLVKGVESNQDKEPYKDIDPLEAKIESQFLMPVYTGMSIAPFRILEKNTAIIPHTKKAGLMDAAEASKAGYTNLSSYLGKVEKIWNKHSKGNMTFKQNIDFRNKLNNQFVSGSNRLFSKSRHQPSLKVVYAASGTYPAAALLEEDTKVIIDTSLYYTQVANRGEGLYLEGILNSEAIMQKIEGLQSQGQWGARHIHRHLLKPYFPKYNPGNALHKGIVSHVEQIRQIAHNVELSPNCNFKKARSTIRIEIQASVVWSYLNKLVNMLLDKNHLQKKTKQI